MVQVNPEGIGNQSLDHIAVADYRIGRLIAEFDVPVAHCLDGATLHGSHRLPSRESDAAWVALNLLPQRLLAQLLQFLPGPVPVVAFDNPIIDMRGDCIACLNLECLDGLARLPGAFEGGSNDPRKRYQPETFSNLLCLFAPSVVEVNSRCTPSQDALRVRSRASVAYEQAGWHHDSLEGPLHSGIAFAGVLAVSAHALPMSVRARQNGDVIRGVGVYHSDGLLDDFPSMDDITDISGVAGDRARSQLVSMRDRAAEVTDGFVWVGLLDPTKAELSMIAEVFALEPLQVEDAANPRQRAKIDISEDGALFAVINTLGYHDESAEVETGQIAIFTGPGFAITVRHGTHGDLAAVRTRIGASRVLRMHGPLSVLYSIMDMTVDGYLAVTDEVLEDVGEVETDVFAMNPTPGVTRRIYDLKRENMSVRRAVNPLVAVAHELAAETFKPIPEDLKPYFRDVGEHILRVHDTVESADSLLMTMLMASTALQDLQQNADTRKISAWVAIAAVPTVAGGIYGMNFEYMPELSWKWSYPIVLGVLATICLLLYRGFKRNGWL